MAYVLILDLARQLTVEIYLDRRFLLLLFKRRLPHLWCFSDLLRVLINWLNSFEPIRLLDGLAEICLGWYIFWCYLPCCIIMSYLQWFWSSCLKT